MNKTQVISCNKIKISLTGKILEGNFKDWYIFIENDLNNSEGFLILIFNNVERMKSSKGLIIGPKIRIH